MRLKPTMNRPIATTTTETAKLAMVSGTLYRMVWPEIVKPSIAMKCIAQMPVAPRDTAASTSHRARRVPA